MKNMTIIVVSDVHLGYKNCNKKDFNDFLDELNKRNDLNNIVICGDFIDMWRRDLVGVMLENADIFVKLDNLQKSGVTIDYVAGNHDYHVLKLKNFDYQFIFHDELFLTVSGIKYKFLHGYEFDCGQDKVYFDALCYSNDKFGDIAGNAWRILNSGKSWLGWIFGFLDKGKDMRKLKALLMAPEERLKDAIVLETIEKKACSSVKKGETLIFGHTHEPFINTKENVANAGSWVKDHTPSNTYLEIINGKISLKVFGGEDITKRFDC